MLSFPEGKIRVIAPDVGGSFGVKIQTYQEELLLPYLSRELGRPIKWCETRVEHMRNGRHGRDQIHYIEMALKKDGTMLAIKDKIIADMGSTYTVDHSIQAAALYMTGVYQIQNYAVDAFGVATNKTTHGSLRGIGKADASYILERLVDIAARELKLDPIDIRMKNFIPADAFPYRNATGALYDSGQYHLGMKRTAEMAGYEKLRKEQAELRKKGIYRGIGVALVMEPTSSSRIHATGGYASCRLRIDPSGAATVFSSMGEQGQGHETTLAQIVASQTGIPFDKITVIHGDTLADSLWFRHRQQPLVGGFDAFGLGGGQIDARQDSRHRRAAVERGSGKARDRRWQSVREGKSRAVHRADGNCPHRLRRDSSLPENMEPGLEVTGYFINPNIDYKPDEKGG